MKICAPAKLDDNIRMIGDMGLPAFLIDAPLPFLFDAGMSFMGPAYAKAIAEALGPRQPHLLCITHSHYDHLGACSFLKSYFPGLRIAGHPLVGEVMKNPRAVAAMTHLSDVVRQMVGAMDRSTEFTPPPISILRFRREIPLSPVTG